MHWLLELAKGLSSLHSIADIGCGTTNTLDSLKGILKIDRCIGVDWSQEAIQQQKDVTANREGEWEWKVWDISIGPVPSIPTSSVDFVYSSHVIEHVGNPYQLLDEQYRICREGGVVAVVAPLGSYAKDHLRVLEINDVVGMLQQYAKPIICYPDMCQSELVAGIIKAR